MPQASMSERRLVPLESIQRPILVVPLSSARPSQTRRPTIEGEGRGRHRKYLPYVLTEHGAIMAASVLNRSRAVQMSLYVVRAFLRLRE